MSGVGLKSRIKVRIYTDVVSNAYCKIQVRTMKIPKIKSRIRLGVRTRFQIRNKYDVDKRAVQERLRKV